MVLEIEVLAALQLGDQLVAAEVDLALGRDGVALHREGGRGAGRRHGSRGFAWRVRETGNVGAEPPEERYRSNPKENNKK